MKIYFSGSIYGGRQKLETYQKLIQELQKKHQVLNEEVADESVVQKEEGIPDEEIFERLEKKLEQADLIFAELTVPSLGVGYEIGYADSHQKRIIGIYDETVTPKITTMLRGNKRIQLIPYMKIENVINNLENILKS